MTEEKKAQPWEISVDETFHLISIQMRILRANYEFVQFWVSRKLFMRQQALELIPLADNILHLITNCRNGMIAVLDPDSERAFAFKQNRRILKNCEEDVRRIKSGVDPILKDIEAEEKRNHDDSEGAGETTASDVKRPDSRQRAKKTGASGSSGKRINFPGPVQSNDQSSTESGDSTERESGV